MTTPSVDALFTDFRNSPHDPTAYVVFELDSGYRVQLPASGEDRWSTDLAYHRQQRIELLNMDRGIVSACLQGTALHVGQITVERTLWRQGIATSMMMRLFAVAKQHGAETSSGTAFNRKSIGMYSKMVGADNVRIIENSASELSVEAVLAELPVQHVNDDHYCSYEISLRDLRPEYTIAVANTTG